MGNDKGIAALRVLREMMNSPSCKFYNVKEEIEKYKVLNKRNGKDGEHELDTDGD